MSPREVFLFVVVLQLSFGFSVAVRRGGGTGTTQSPTTAPTPAPTTPAPTTPAPTPVAEFPRIAHEANTTSSSYNNDGSAGVQRHYELTIGDTTTVEGLGGYTCQEKTAVVKAYTAIAQLSTSRVFSFLWEQNCTKAENTSLTTLEGMSQGITGLTSAITPVANVSCALSKTLKCRVDMEDVHAGWNAKNFFMWMESGWNTSMSDVCAIYGGHGIPAELGESEDQPSDSGGLSGRDTSTGTGKGTGTANAGGTTTTTIDPCPTAQRAFPTIRCTRDSTAHMLLRHIGSRLNTGEWQRPCAVNSASGCAVVTGGVYSGCVTQALYDCCMTDTCGCSGLCTEMGPVAGAHCQRLLAQY